MISQRLDAGPLTEYSQFGEGIPFGEATPRAGNDSGGGQPGRILKCKGWETDPNAYTYFITHGSDLGKRFAMSLASPIGKPKKVTQHPPERLDKLNEIFERVEKWTHDQNQI